MSNNRMTPKEHEYLHQLLLLWAGITEPKFEKGCIEHRKESDLWDLSDEALDKCIQEEIIDLMVYWSEKLRRKNERRRS